MKIEDTIKSIRTATPKTLHKLYETVCDTYKQRLCEQLDVTDAYWIGDRVGCCLDIAEYYTIDMPEIVLLVDNCINFYDFDSWYQQWVDEENARRINLRSWIMGARAEIFKERLDVQDLDFNSLSELYETFPDEQSCIDHLEWLRWEGKVLSPFDSSSIVYKCKGNKYRCKNTGKYFNVKTNTLFDSTKVSLRKWFAAIWIFENKRKLSSTELAKIIGVSQRTAYNMLQKLNKLHEEESKTHIQGTL